MVKNIFLVIFSIVLVCALVLLSCAPAPTPPPAPTPSPIPTPTSPPIKLIYGHQNPENGWEVVNCSKPWMKKVETATKGKVTIDAYFAQSLFKATDALEAAKRGQADIVFLNIGYFPGIFSLAEVVNLPLLPVPSCEALADVSWQLVEKYPSMAKQYEDMKLLAFALAGTSLIITRDKQIRTMDDIKGMKIRIASGPPAEALKALGGIPQFMPVTDIYMNLEKGVIDGAITTWEAIMSWRLYEVLKYYTYVPFVTSTLIIVMNLNKWKSLPPDVQEAIMSVSGRGGSAWWSKVFGDESVIEGKKIAKSSGAQVNEYTLPPDELEKWTKIAREATWEKWVKDNEAKGLTNARDILNDTIKMLQTWKRN